jgi:hypothetical protein
VRLPDSPRNTEIRNALYWLRRSYIASTVPEAFLFTWKAVEQLAGPESVREMWERRSPARRIRVMGRTPT